MVLAKYLIINNVKELKIMCLKNYQPVEEHYSPCSNCKEYLTTCMPIIIDGFIYGECDIFYCEWCIYYNECLKGADAT